MAKRRKSRKHAPKAQCGLTKAAAKSKAKHVRKAGKKAHIKKGAKGHGWCAVPGKKRKK